MIDSHCHIDLAAFDADRDNVLTRAFAAGIERLLVLGLSNQQFEKLRVLKRQYQQIDIALGLHPYYLKDLDRPESLFQEPNPQLSHLQKLPLQASHLQPTRLGELQPQVLYSQKSDFTQPLPKPSKVQSSGLKHQANNKTQAMLDELSCLADLHSGQYIAFGEMGLDGSLALDMDYQKTILRFQLNLAVKYNKPVILHHRKSHNQLISLLKEQKYQGGGILHAFSGSYYEAKTYVDMGFLLGVGGTITYPRAVKTRNSIAKLPLDKLVIETDSPDMPINGFQGQRNEPSQLVHVLKALSELKNMNQREVEAQTSANYLALLGPSLNR